MLQSLGYRALLVLIVVVLVGLFLPIGGRASPPGNQAFPAQSLSGDSPSLPQAQASLPAQPPAYLPSPVVSLPEAPQLSAPNSLTQPRIKGIDVSSTGQGSTPTAAQSAASSTGQGISIPRTLRWQKVHDAGKVFAWAKATDGSASLDQSFDLNMTQGGTASLFMGAYHYARQNANTGAVGAQKEATFFWNTASPYFLSGRLRPFLDVEDKPPEGTTAGYKKVADWIHAWMEKVSELSGGFIEPILYTDQSYANELLKADPTIANYTLLIAQYPWQPNPDAGAGPSLLNGAQWSCWQYSENGTTLGIYFMCGGKETTGCVDWDVYAGDEASFNQMLIPSFGQCRMRMALTVPAAAGEPVVRGQSLTIRWISFWLPTEALIDIQCRAKNDDGTWPATWTSLYHGADTRQWTWSVPAALPPGDYQLHLGYDTGSGWMAGTEDTHAFRIVETTGLKLISPQGGPPNEQKREPQREVWYQENNKGPLRYDLEWIESRTATSITSFRLKLSTDGGKSFTTTIAQNLTARCFSYYPINSNLGSKELSRCRVLLEALDAQGKVVASDQSSGDFTIRVKRNSDW